MLTYSFYKEFKCRPDYVPGEFSLKRGFRYMLEQFGRYRATATVAPIWSHRQHRDAPKLGAS